MLASKASLRKQQWCEFAVGSCLLPPFSNHIHIYRTKNLLIMHRKLKYQIRKEKKKNYIPSRSITTMLMNTLHPLNIIFRQHLCSGRSYKWKCQKTVRKNTKHSSHWLGDQVEQTLQEEGIMWITSRVLLWLEQCIKIPEAGRWSIIKGLKSKSKKILVTTKIVG